MHVIYVTTEFKTETRHDGGLASYLNNISHVFATNNHKITILVSSDNNPSELTTEDGVRVFRIKRYLLFRVLNKMSLSIFYGTLKRIDFAFGVYQCLRNLQKKEKIDIVQYPNYYAPGIIAIPLLKIKHTTRVSSDRSTWNSFSKMTLDYIISDLMEKLQFKFSQNIFSPTRKLKTILQKRLSDKNIKIIPTLVSFDNLVEDSSFHNAELSDKKYILYFGRLEIRKGLKLLIDSLPLFFNQTNGHAVFIGRDIGSEDIKSFELYAQAKCVQFKERLHFYDPLDHPELIPVIRNSQFVVLPSIIDNMPNTLLESIYLGKPAIIQYNSGNEEIIDNGYNGLIVNNSVSDLANAMINLYNDNDALKIMSKNAKISSEKFSANSIYGKTIQYYKSLVL